MGPEKRIKLAIVLVVVFLVAGTAGYVLIDNYSLLDAIYMTVITITTVGYGEIQNLSELGRIFTIFLILFSVGSIALLAGAFSEILIERAANPMRSKKKMEKRISKLTDHVIICGHGRVGATAAEYFHRNNSPFVVLDNEPEALQDLEELGYCFLNGDGTREEILLKANIKKAKAVLAVMDSDPENLFAVLTARELNPVLRIIARTESVSSERRLLRAGADSVISPFVTAGMKVAKSLMAGDDEIEMNSIAAPCLREGTNWIEVTEETNLAGKSIGEISQIDSYCVVGYRRQGHDSLMPEATLKVELGDKLLVMNLELKEETPRACNANFKIVLIDDNPVITSLYTRLFQKEGFVVFSASSGREGYELIIEELPDIAVIDFHLPDMSGIDVCSKIKAHDAIKEIRVCLFTADEQSSTRELAKGAGADCVVVKSPETSEVLDQVKKLLEI